MKKKLIAGAAVVFTLFLISIPIAPIGPSCAKGSPSLCGLISNIALVVGGAIVLKSEIENHLLPGTQVLVELDNGQIKSGTLTRKATNGRPVKKGEKIRLNCLKSYTSVENSNLKTCELEFFGFDPFSPCSKGTPCYGKIPSWSITVDELGIPDSQLLRYSK